MSLRPWLLTLVAGLCLVGLAVKAEASEAFIIENTSLFAGPDYDLPQIERLRHGSIVDVIGCIDGYQWCDIVTDDERGWVPGDFLEFEVGGRREPVYSAAPFLGLMILGFSLDEYWGEHYHQRPWFHDRDHWRRPEWDHRTPGHEPHFEGAPEPRHDGVFPHAPLGGENGVISNAPHFEQPRHQFEMQHENHDGMQGGQRPAFEMPKGNNEGGFGGNQRPHFDMPKGGMGGGEMNNGHGQQRKNCQPGTVCE